jgi:protein involved in polysaccharide export with SLBB domain
MIAMKRIALTVLALAAGVMVAAAQNRGVQVGNGIKLTLRGVPAEDAAQVTGLYQVTENGTIRLPHLETRVRVLGLKADQVGEAVENAYRRAGIYSRPTVEAVIVTEPVGDPDGATVSVGGQVVRPGKVPFKHGMLLIEAIQGAGDRTPFGGREIELTRNGKLQTLDYRNAEARNLVLQPGDVIHVRQRKVTEFDRGG